MKNRVIFFLSLVSLGVCAIQTEAAYPGGVSNNCNAWFKADAGTTVDGSDNITSWNDQSGNGNNSISVSSNPNLQQDRLNFNPAVEFDGNDYINLPNGTWTSGTGSYTGFVVAHVDTNAWHPIASGGTESADQRFWIGASDDYRITDAWWGSGNDLHSADNILTSGHPFLGSYNYHNSTGREIFHNGTSAGTDSATDRNHGTASNRIGARPNLSEIMNGKVGEIIVFNAALSTTERRQVESYLAIKYGLTLDNGSGGIAYINSQGTTIFNESSYGNDIAIIGRDDDSALGQIKSQSINSDALLLITADGEGTNSSPVWSDISDREFLGWGNDNANSTVWTTSEAPTAWSRLAREWRFREPNGDVGSVTLSVNNSDLPAGISGNLYVLTDADGNFSSGASTTEMTNTSGVWSVTLNLTDAIYLTLGYTVGTPTFTPTNTQTLTQTPTSTTTYSPTTTQTHTITPTRTPSATYTVTPTITQTSTITVTSTHSPVFTPTTTPTITQTSTITMTSTITVTSTISPTSTISATATVSPTASFSPTITITATPNLAAADLTRVIGYPNPYVGDVNRREQIVFINLPERVAIRLYSLEGQLVRQIIKDDPGNQITWNLKNEAGAKVASGVYLYIMKTSFGERKGKLAIIR